MRLVMVVVALFATVAFVTPAGARTAHLGTPRVLMAFPREAYLMGAMSVPGHGDAFAVFRYGTGFNVYSVVYIDDDGHAHRFDLPDTTHAPPYAIRFAALEDGGAMAIWDQNTRVLARAWRRDGTLGPVQVVLAGVTTVHAADNDSAQWRVRSDRAGTVVVASTGAVPHDSASVFATVPGARHGLRRAAGAHTCRRDRQLSAPAADLADRRRRNGRCQLGARLRRRTRRPRGANRA